nr:uncharacterized mitochondrial protein AtMg00810-like [Tanacetum cinerariifolium]
MMMRDPSFGDGNVMASSNIDSSYHVNEEATFATKLDETNNISEGILVEMSGSRSGIKSQSRSTNGDEPQTMRKSRRISNFPSKFNDFILPSNKKLLKISIVEAMNNETEALFRNNTWVLIELPANRKTIGRDSIPFSFFKGVIDSGWSRHMTGNMSYLFDFEEINGGYVSFGGNPKGGKITRKGKTRTGKLDFDDVCFVKELKFNFFSVSQMVPRENNIYNVDLKNIFPSGDLTCLFAKAALDESNLWHRRLGHINFETMNKLVKGFMRPFGCPVTILNTLDTLGKFNGKADEGFLVGYSISRSGPTWLFDIDTLTKSMNYQPVIAGNQPNPNVGIQKHFDADKAVEGNVQQYRAKTKKHDDKTNKKAKGKSLVKFSTGVRNLSEEFEDFSNNNTNEVNVASTPVPAVGQNSNKSTNIFSAAGPSNTAASPTLGKSLYVDPSQYPDDPNMPALEDITFSDNEEDVATQTRSMTRMVKDQGGLTQINNEDFHTCMFACFLSQKEPKRVHQALKDPSWIEAMQEELLRFKMQKVWVLVDLPKGFEDSDYPDKVYKVVKALYELHQAPRAWYNTLANYLLENDFQKGKIDQTLFIKKQKGDILLVQVYVDDIIFGTTNKELCKAFEKLIKDKFQMSSMGELAFFLGLQVKQKQDEIFISQDKYVAEILRKFGLTDGKPASTPIDIEKPLLNDPDGEDVDVHAYMSIIGSLMYLNSSRPDIMFAICACARFQVTPKASHLHAVKRIFRYLKGKPHLGLWYPKDSPFNLVAYSDSDYAGVSLDRKSTTGGCQFLGCRLISWQCKKQTVVGTSSIEAEYVAAASCCAQVLWIQNQLLDYGIDCLPNEEIFAELERMGYEKPSTKLTFYKAFFSAQWKFLMHIILQCMSAKRTTWSEFSSSMASAVICLTTDAQVGDLSSYTTKYTSPALTQKVFANMRRAGKGFSRVDTPLFEGMLVPQQAHDDVVADDIDDDVADDVADVVADADEIGEKEQVESFWVEEIEEGGIIAKLDADEDVTLEEVAAEVEKDAEVAKKDAEDDKAEPAKLKEVIEVVTTAKLMIEVVTAAATTIAATTITAAPSAARRRKGVVIRDPEETATHSIIVHSEPKSKDKGKGILVEEPKPLKKQAQIKQDKAYVGELKAKLNANINWYDVIEKVERKEKQDNAVLRYRALKRKPQTEAQARKNMMVYLKNMTGFKMDFFKGMSYDDIGPIFEKHFNSIVGFLEKSEEQLEKEASKALKRKSENDVYTEATPLALMVPVVDYQIHTKNNKPYYKIIRADGTHQLFLSFISLLRNFDREDLEMLWQIVQERFASSNPKNFSNDFLLNTLKEMFKKSNVEASIWKSQRGNYGLAKVKSWNFLESCRVHIITFTTTQMILLVERRYPLTRFTLDQMLNNARLEVEKASEVSLELLRFVRRQQQEGYMPE